MAIKYKKMGQNRRNVKLFRLEYSVFLNLSWDVKKFGGQVEELAKMSGKRFQANGFRIVMAAIVNVHAFFLGEMIKAVSRLAGDERLDTETFCLWQKRRADAGANANIAKGCRAKRIQTHVIAEQFSDVFEKIVCCHFRFCPPVNGNRRALVVAEVIFDFEVERIGNLRIVADFRVRIERQVSAVEIHPRGDERFDARIIGAGDRLLFSPEKTMVHN